MTLAALPAARLCRRADCALVVADIQQTIGDAMPGKVLNRVVLNAGLLARSAALLDVPTLHTEHAPASAGPTLDAVRDALGEQTSYFSKRSYSCCGADGFQASLDRSGRRQVVIVGMESHVAVLQTALELAAAGLDIYVVEDAICSRRLENYQNALDRLRQSGVTVVSAESVVFEWLGHADHDAAPAVQALLR